MQPLEKPLRNQLEKTVKEARDIAETAARAALEQLGVGEAAPYSHLGDPERELRRKLRAHGRQLGDNRNSKTEMQEIDRLVEEVAYEHWHRMLFARFLAENNLLMYPDPDDPVAVTLEECEDLATDEGAKNGWELASRFAARMLPQIFRPDSPVFQLELPPEHQQKLERLVAELPEEVFTASDSLGWVYQFWQTKKKDEVNASEVKIDARELPAVTQLFTEPYMVSFLLDNSLGAWWASKRLTESDLRYAQSEEELRQKAALPGVPLKYLRFVRSEDGRWTPAGGTFDGWPEHLRELKTLDPCCGSGHFLVAAFVMLVAMRMELEGLSARDAVDAVLRENLHGLEIDQRCVELAAFALALTAWRYPGAGGYRNLPELNLACSGLSVSVAKEEWKQLAMDKHNLRIALDWMYDVFRDAPILGSLLNPAKTDAAKIVSWDELSEAISKGLGKQNGDEERREAGTVAYGLARAATLLSRKYHWVITNVPYLSTGRMGRTLRSFCDKTCNDGKHDLATVFLDRCILYLAVNGSMCLVLPQNWLFLPRYTGLRKRLLSEISFQMISQLGPGAFETIGGEVVKACLVMGKSEKPSSRNIITGIDVTNLTKTDRKASELELGPYINILQENQLNNPDARILLEERDEHNLLSEYAESRYGLRTADSPRFIIKYWEIYNRGEWIEHQSTMAENKLFTGREHLLRWSDDLLDLANQGIASLQGEDAWGKKGIAVSLAGRIRSTLYSGTLLSG